MQKYLSTSVIDLNKNGVFTSVTLKINIKISYFTSIQRCKNIYFCPSN